MTSLENTQRYNEPLLCLGCGNEGRAYWEDGYLIGTSDRFYLRVRLPLSAEPDVACETCGEIQKRSRHFRPGQIEYAVTLQGGQGVLPVGVS
jgi:hypothetical protein